MTFTKQMAADNKVMLGRARELLLEAGYDPADTPYGDSLVHRNFVRPFYDYALPLMEAEFPHVTPERIHNRVTRAKTQLYGEWVNERGLE
jgi:hypothetical protein